MQTASAGRRNRSLPDRQGRTNGRGIGSQFRLSKAKSVPYRLTNERFVTGELEEIKEAEEFLGLRAKQETLCCPPRLPESLLSKLERWKAIMLEGISEEEYFNCRWEKHNPLKS